MSQSLLSFLLIFAAFSALSIRMNRHSKAALGYQPSAKALLLLGCTGWGLLLLSLPWPIHHYGVSIGISVWLGLLSVAAFCVALLHTWLPHVFRYVTTLVLMAAALIAASFIF